MANILTLTRILCGALLLIFPAFSGWYYVLYLLGGFTDAIDGTVARKTGKASEKGAKLDTAADIVFTLAVILKLVYSLSVPAWLLIWIGAIGAWKVFSVLAGFLRYHRFIAVHSVFNKICGVLVFIPPLFIGGPYPRQAKILVVSAVCLFASAAAVLESVYIRNGRNIE